MVINMLSFEPIQLMRVKLEQEELRKSSREVPLQLNIEYKKLFRQIALSGIHHAGSWNYALTKQERLLLCQYLYEDAEEQEVEELAAVICARIDADLLVLIYQKSQYYYKEARLAKAFHCFRLNRGLGELFYSFYGFRSEDFYKAVIQNTAAEYVNNMAGTGSYASESGYVQRLKAMGIDSKSLLYQECSRLFITVCNGVEYMRIGAEELLAMTSGQSREVKISLLRNMLRNLDNYQLRGFFPMLKEFKELTGDPGSKIYKECIQGMSAEEMDRYKLWLNQYQIVAAMKDQERSNFWLSYLNQCVVRIQENLGVVLLIFREFTVIEFFSADKVAYFYGNQYMENIINEGLAAADSEEKFEEWLFHSTEWGAQGTHTNHWRKAHKGDWMMDMRSYIMKRNTNFAK